MKPVTIAKLAITIALVAIVAPGFFPAMGLVVSVILMLVAPGFFPAMGLVVSGPGAAEKIGMIPAEIYYVFAVALAIVVLWIRFAKNH